MKKNYSSAILFLLPFHSFAQFPSLSQHTASTVTTVEFWYENCFLNQSCHDKKDKVKAEIPPCVMGGGWRSYFMVDGINTYIWSTPKSFTDNSLIDFKNESSGPITVSYPQTNVSTAATNNWKRNYHSVYSAQYLNHPTQGPISIGILHGENKNVSSNCTSGNVMNTINPNIAISCSNHDTWSGGNPYKDGWLAYHALVSVAWYPNNQSTNWGQHEFSNHVGPISWPSNSFIAPDNRVATTGHSHPSSILANGYMYIFYSDAGPWGDHIQYEEGRLKGVKVVRVLQSDVLDASKYEIYYKDPNGNVSWPKSLPTGFTKETMLNYTRVKGPKSTDVLNIPASANNRVIRFSVAKVRNTNYFMGLEEYIDDNESCLNGELKYKLALRFSSDLINWTDRQMYVTTPKCWSEHNMRYPIFLDRTGWTNTEVDLNEFYILGTASINKSVNKIRVFDLSRPPRRETLATDTLSRAVMNRIGLQNPKLLEENLEKENIFIYPNPASRIVNLDFNNARQATNINIVLFDINGRKVKEIANAVVVRQGSSVTQIDVSKLSKGTYFIKILTDNKTLFSKLIVL